MNQDHVVADCICPNCGARLGAPNAKVKGGDPGAMCPKCRKVWRVPERKPASGRNSDREV